MKSLLITILLLFIYSDITAQDRNIEVELSGSLNTTPDAIMDLLTLSFDTILPEPFLYSTIRNHSDEPISDLYMDIIVSSRNDGVLLHSYHEPLLSFSIPENDFISSNDKEIASGSFLNRNEGVRFNFILTEKGQDIIRSLQQSQLLPADVFTIEVIISEGAAAKNKGERIASKSITFDLNPIGALTTQESSPEGILNFEFLILN